MRKMLILLAALGLSGCAAMRAEQASKMMDTYVGRPVSDVALRFGPPTAQFDTGNQHMAFQWEHQGAGQTPGMATRVGPTAIYTAPQVYATHCRLSIVARPLKPKPASLADWQVASWEAAGNGCV